MSERHRLELIREAEMLAKWIQESEKYLIKENGNDN